MLWQIFTRCHHIYFFQERTTTFSALAMIHYASEFHVDHEPRLLHQIRVIDSLKGGRLHLQSTAIIAPQWPVVSSTKA